MRLDVKGMFTGAKVTRGKDWSSINRIDENEKEGEILEILEFDGIAKSGARVDWKRSSSPAKHRVGHRGKVFFNQSLYKIWHYVHVLARSRNHCIIH